MNRRPALITTVGRNNQTKQATPKKRWLDYHVDPDGFEPATSTDYNSRAQQPNKTSHPKKRDGLIIMWILTDLNRRPALIIPVGRNNQTKQATLRKGMA
ncbi:MAG: hypothetical protein EAY75_12955 [Bacteroidetes bacterium]|nr:MAG: hypothetical protein EAY75_12955 [Bacteroidota bacterium]